MKRAIYIFILLVISFIIISCQKNCSHQWAEATVDAPKTCSICGLTDGDKLIKIPNIIGIDETSAKNILISKGIIPKIKYGYSDEQGKNLVYYVKPRIGRGIKEDDVVTVFVSLGPEYYQLNNAVGIIEDIDGIEPFDWDNGTKDFSVPYIMEGFLYIDIYLRCTSQYTLSFYKDFGTAAIKDEYDKTVPIEVLYKSEVINNNGELTEFTLKIPLNDLDEDTPTNIYTEFYFLVNEEIKAFKASFDLSW